MAEKLPAKKTRASIASFVKKIVGKVTGYDLAIDALEVLKTFRREQIEGNLALFFEKIARGEDVYIAQVTPQMVPMMVQVGPEGWTVE